MTASTSSAAQQRDGISRLSADRTERSLASILTHEYAFFARMTGLNDGPDSFFIVPDVQAVPGPIVGAGLPGSLSRRASRWWAWPDGAGGAMR